MTARSLTRRVLMASAAGAATVAAAAPFVRAQETVGVTGQVFAKYVPETSDFPYEVRRDEAEWRAMFPDEEAYGILRRSNTEWPKTTDL